MLYCRDRINRPIVSHQEDTILLEEEEEEEEELALVRVGLGPSSTPAAVARARARFDRDTVRRESI